MTKFRTGITPLAATIFVMHGAKQQFIDRGQLSVHYFQRYWACFWQVFPAQ
ncbi:hypothetical protein IQ266_11005 [filamentous cyanobacterium LEGE 11480]|uniref:Uncharacterized protein n=1 Tax=Romeriopsis navalis LEGE 11480 TaxID=2777977 RepID=A0A928Z343_9CYAN|nr:hypothetical protein [Romeriopsis navalis]MBE9030259.1 hypothetical protein [Romeriopsis navalis LEGE 11480]